MLTTFSTFSITKKKKKSLLLQNWTSNTHTHPKKKKKKTLSLSNPHLSLDFSPTNTYMVVTTLSKKLFEISKFKQSITPNIFHQSKLKLGNTCEIQVLVFLFSLLLCFSKSTKLWGSQVCLFNSVGFDYSFHLSSIEFNLNS